MAKLALRAKVEFLVFLLLMVAVGLCYSLDGGSLTSKAVVSPYPHSRLSRSSELSFSTVSVVAVNDSNWAGYIVASDLQNPQALVTNVSASWTVPTVAPALQNTFSAVWIGIGGFFDTTLIQTGTEQDFYNGASDYSAWYELIPQTSVTIDTMTVSPGDQMSASITLINTNTNDWSVTISDVTSNQTFQNNFFYAASRLSAEWVVERPATGSRIISLATLADVGLVTLTNCQATVGNSGGPISAFPVVESVMYQTVQNNGNGIGQLAAVSNLQADGLGFTVQTSPSVVPELFDLSVLPLILASAAFAVVTKKRVVKKER